MLLYIFHFSNKRPNHPKAFAWIKMHPFKTSVKIPFQKTSTKNLDGGQECVYFYWSSECLSKLSKCESKLYECNIIFFCQSDFQKKNFFASRFYNILGVYFKAVTQMCSTK